MAAPKALQTLRRSRDFRVAEPDDRAEETHDGRYLVSCLSQDPYKRSVLRLLDLIEGTSRDIPVPEVKLIIGLDWTANGHTILVTGYMGRGGRSTESGLVSVSLDGQTKKLFEAPNFDFSSLVPSPDGRHFAIAANTVKANISLLENF